MRKIQSIPDNINRNCQIILQSQPTIVKAIQIAKQTSAVVIILILSQRFQIAVRAGMHISINQLYDITYSRLYPVCFRIFLKIELQTDFCLNHTNFAYNDR